MARFIIQGVAASFIDCGTHKMVSVAMMSAPLVREIVDVKTVDALKPEFDRVRLALDLAGSPYSLNARLVSSDRAPRGWNDRKGEFRFDSDCGQSVAA